MGRHGSRAAASPTDPRPKPARTRGRMLQAGARTAETAEPVCERRDFFKPEPLPEGEAPREERSRCTPALPAGRGPSRPLRFVAERPCGEQPARQIGPPQVKIDLFDARQPDRAARMPSGHPVQRMPPLRDIPSTRKSRSRARERCSWLVSLSRFLFVSGEGFKTLQPRSRSEAPTGGGDGLFRTAFYLPSPLPAKEGGSHPPAGGKVKK